MGLQTDHRFTLAMVAAVDDLVLQGAATSPIPETNRSCQECNSGSIQKERAVNSGQKSIDMYMDIKVGC